jgi:hypothetical protein
VAAVDGAQKSWYDNTGDTDTFNFYGIDSNGRTVEVGVIGGVAMLLGN